MCNIHYKIILLEIPPWPPHPQIKLNHELQENNPKGYVTSIWSERSSVNQFLIANIELKVWWQVWAYSKEVKCILNAIGLFSHIFRELGGIFEISEPKPFDLLRTTLVLGLGVYLVTIVGFISNVDCYSFPPYVCVFLVFPVYFLTNNK